MKSLMADVVVQSGGGGGWGLSFGQLAIFAVIVMGAIALLVIAIRKFKIQVPDWLLQAIGVVIVCFVIIVCIRLVLSM